MAIRRYTTGPRLCIYCKMAHTPAICWSEKASQNTLTSGWEQERNAQCKTNLGHSDLSFFFLGELSRPRPQTTFESTDMTGSTLEHVTHSGSGFPSGPRGTSLVGTTFAESVSCVADGLARKLRGSTSSFLTLTSSLLSPVRLGVDIFSRPPPLSEVCEDERVIVR